MEKQAVKKVSDSLTEQVHLIMPPPFERRRPGLGGMLLQWIDEVAGVVAKRHSGCQNVTTAAIDNLQFKAVHLCRRSGGADWQGDLHRKNIHGSPCGYVCGKQPGDAKTGQQGVFLSWWESIEEDKPIPVPALLVETESGAGPSGKGRLREKNTVCCGAGTDFDGKGCI